MRILVTLALLVAPALAQVFGQGQTLNTVGGELKHVESPAGDHQLTLHGKTILKDFVTFELTDYFRGVDEKYDAILFVSGAGDNGPTACGGKYQFLLIREDGSYFLSPEIGPCQGLTGPTVVRKRPPGGEEIVVSFPPTTETWVYRQGRFSEVKPKPHKYSPAQLDRTDGGVSQ
jgi:hypothetical protein